MGKRSTPVGQTPNSLFISMGLDMSWRLALGVLVPIIGGVELDKALNSSPAFLLAGFVVSIILATVIIRRSVKIANNHPVFNQPKAKGKNNA